MFFQVYELLHLPCINFFVTLYMVYLKTCPMLQQKLGLRLMFLLTTF
jgi:hypothetical protein